MSRRRLAVLALALAGTLLLGGCAPASDDAELRALVAAAAEQVSTGDLDAALVRMDELEAEVVDRVDAGTLTGARAAGIRASIALVRADLAAMMTPTEPEPEPEPEVEPAPEPVQPTEPVSDSDPDDAGDDGNGNSGPGKGNEGKGKDNGGPGSGNNGKGKGNGKP